MQQFITNLYRSIFARNPRTSELNEDLDSCEDAPLSEISESITQLNDEVSSGFSDQSEKIDRLQKTLRRLTLSVENQGEKLSDFLKQQISSEQLQGWFPTLDLCNNLERIARAGRGAGSCEFDSEELNDNLMPPDERESPLLDYLNELRTDLCQRAGVELAARIGDSLNLSSSSTHSQIEIAGTKPALHPEQNGCVVEILKQGYLSALDGEILRRAIVVVGEYRHGKTDGCESAEIDMVDDISDASEPII